MALPTFEQFLFPMLERLAASGDGGSKLADFLPIFARRFEITEEDLSLKTKSGNSVFYGWLGWSMSYLKAAGLIENLPETNWRFRVTARGMDFLKKTSPRLCSSGAGRIRGIQKIQRQKYQFKQI